MRWVSSIFWGRIRSASSSYSPVIVSAPFPPYLRVLYILPSTIHHHQVTTSQTAPSSLPGSVPLAVVFQNGRTGELTRYSSPIIGFEWQLTAFVKSCAVKWAQESCISQPPLSFRFICRSSSTSRRKINFKTRFSRSFVHGHAQIPLYCERRRGLKGTVVKAPTPSAPLNSSRKGKAGRGRMSYEGKHLRQPADAGKFISQPQLHGWQSLEK